MPVATSTANLYVSGVRWDRVSVLRLLPLVDCDGCGKCCMLCDSTMVQDYERQRIEEIIGRPIAELKAKGEHWTMAQPCQFRDVDEGCLIYGVRPVVCKYFPLISWPPEGNRDDGKHTVAVTTGFCEAGRRCVEQLAEWQGQ